VPSQDGGYVLLWQRYDNNKMADMCYYGNVILHLQQYSHRLNLFNFFCIVFLVFSFLVFLRFFVVFGLLLHIVLNFSLKLCTT